MSFLPVPLFDLMAPAKNSVVAAFSWKLLESSGGDVFKSGWYFTRFTSGPCAGLVFARTGSWKASRAFSSKVYQ